MTAPLPSDPTDILNWRRRDAQITLSGQPTADQLQRLAETGVRVVINLGPHDSPKALPNEPQLVTELGMRYVHVPVDFDRPTQADFDKFCQALSELGSERAHVHCIYNARVSAFMLRYAQEGRGGSITAAHKLMDSIWRPGGAWAEFLGDADNMVKPNRYAGDDY